MVAAHGFRYLSYEHILLETFELVMSQLRTN